MKGPKAKSRAAGNGSLDEIAEITTPDSPTTPARDPKRIVISLRNSHTVWFTGPDDLQTAALYFVICDALEGKIPHTNDWVRHEKAMVRMSDIAAVTLG